MKNLLLLLSLAIVFSSCGKEKEMLKYTGTLYQDCAKKPAANREIRVYQDFEDNLIKKNGGELARGTTDNLGNFSLSFKDDGGGGIRIETINTVNPLLLGTIVIEQLEPKNIDLGDIYLNNRGNAYVFVNAANTYTSSDTLVWGFGEYNRIKTSGPFHNSPIDSIINYYFIEKYGSWKESLKWAINPTSEADFHIYYYELSGCGIIDTFIIDID